VPSFLLLKLGIRTAALERFKEENDSASEMINTAGQGLAFNPNNHGSDGNGSDGGKLW
jgi:hypothetical protein